MASSIRTVVNFGTSVTVGILNSPRLAVDILPSTKELSSISAEAEAGDNAAVDLSLVAQVIQYGAGIVDRCQFLHLYLTGSGIHLDFRHLRGE